jgi:hypothetical protein
MGFFAILELYAKMKNMRFLTLFICAFLFTSYVDAQTTGKTLPQTDAITGYTYDYDLAKKVIIDHQLKPGNDNKIAEPNIKSKDFPKLNSEQALNNAYHEKLRVWMEANSALIIETFKSRKDIVRPFGN